jgi:hypothetical protein
MTPRPEGASAYLSKYWPSLNGPTDETTPFAASALRPELQSERESALLDVIGAYDLLLLQGLTAKRTAARLGLSKTRDELVQELDAETTRRLAIPIPAAKEPPRLEAG